MINIRDAILKELKKRELKPYGRKYGSLELTIQERDMRDEMNLISDILRGDLKRGIFN